MAEISFARAKLSEDAVKFIVYMALCGRIDPIHNPDRLDQSRYETASSIPAYPA